MSLISTNEMQALRDVAISGMTTLVSVFHQVVSAGDNGLVATFPAAPDFTVYGMNTEVTPPGVVLAAHTGQIALIETHVLRVPVGTDIRSGDQIVIGGQYFIAQNTSAENTFQPLLQVALHRRE